MSESNQTEISKKSPVQQKLKFPETKPKDEENSIVAPVTPAGKSDKDKDENETESKKPSDSKQLVKGKDDSAINESSSPKLAETVKDDDSVHQRRLAFYEELEDTLEEEDDDSEENDLQVEEEDDENTVESGETSIRNKKKLKKMILPSFTRYQIMIQMDQENRDSPICDDEDEEKSPAQRLRDILISLVTQVSIFDPKAKIISWKTEPNFSYLNAEQFPTQIAQIAQYFNGFRANVKPDKRIYLRVGIHTPDSQSQLYSFIRSWMELYGYTFSKCIIQAENAAFIGWLCYSTSYTDPEVFRSRLVEHSNFEWGFKLVAVTTSDQDLPWLKRLKAVGVYVPSQMQNMAKLILCKQLQPFVDSLINIPDFTDKYLYVEPEKNYASKGGQLYYKKMVERHRLHADSIRAEFSFGISVDLDRDFNLVDGTKVSLRDIILDLRVEDPKSPLHGTRLFHSVDFWVDSSKVWIDNTKGPGASCHVFTYYKQVATEASEMVTGLGKLVISRYDKDLASEMFNLDHFKGNSGYRWSEQKGRFSTPLERQMKQNYRYDNNLQAVNVLRELDTVEKSEKKEQEKSKQKEESMLIVLGHQEKKKQDILDKVMENKPDNNKEDASNTSLSTTGKKIRDTQLVNMLKKQEDPDLDSIDDSSVIRKKVHHLDMEDEVSVASSLTDMSMEEVSDDENTSDFSISTAGGSLSSGISSVAAETVKSDELIKLIGKIASSSDVPLTDKELRQAVHNYQLRRFNKKNQIVTATLEKFIKDRSVSKDKVTEKDEKAKEIIQIDDNEDDSLSFSSMTSKDTTVQTNTQNKDCTTKRNDHSTLPATTVITLNDITKSEMSLSNSESTLNNCTTNGKDPEEQQGVTRQEDDETTKNLIEDTAKVSGEVSVKTDNNEDGNKKPATKSSPTENDELDTNEPPKVPVTVIDNSSKPVESVSDTKQMVGENLSKTDKTGSNGEDREPQNHSQTVETQDGDQVNVNQEGVSTNRHSSIQNLDIRRQSERLQLKSRSNRSKHSTLASSVNAGRWK